MAARQGTASRGQADSTADVATGVVTSAVPQQTFRPAVRDLLAEGHPIAEPSQAQRAA
jgi:hypothetical protein